MTSSANRSLHSESDSSLAEVLAHLSGHDRKSLVIVYPDGTEVQGGYHVTEVKAGSFETLDCGGNPDAWHETVLQVEDIPSRDGKGGMSAGKFRSILARVADTISLDMDARLTIEAGRPGEPMRVHDVAAVKAGGERVFMYLGARPAICKPRHRAVEAKASACCAPTPVATAKACCA